MSQPCVSIITRTKDRLPFLRRAFDSIRRQTFSDFNWIIVNDGGDAALLATFMADMPAGLAVELINNRQNTGRSAAANCGMARASGRYLVLHDDDDSWEPEFLARSVEFLQQNPDYLAVSCHVNEISETVVNDALRVKSKQPAPFNVAAITFGMMANFNAVTTIGCVFQARCRELLNGFDESFAVLEDYDFFLRLLVEGNIGVIPQPLANYHIRQAPHSNAAYNNTVTTGRHWHVQKLAEYQNAQFRKELASGKPGLGFLLAQSHQYHQVRTFHQQWLFHIEGLKRFSGFNLLKRLVKRLLPR